MIKFETPKSETPSAKEIADLDTNECAGVLNVKPGTMRRSYCVNGHYLGLKPKKLPNGHLRWSGKQAKALVEV